MIDVTSQSTRQCLSPVPSDDKNPSIVNDAEAVAIARALRLVAKDKD
jgi:hypothetical protein